MYFLACVWLLLSAADHWTTYLCLREPVSGWQVVEANPLADWMFGSFGLVPGLAVDSVLTLVVVAFVLTSRFIPDVFKGLFFGVVIAGTGLAVYNNFQALAALGLSPLGAA